MDAFLVSAGTGALKTVTAKLAALLGDEFNHMKDVRKEIEFLSRELDWMHASLEGMSKEEDPSDQDKIWMTDVREMSYVIEDSLDDFMICLDDNKSALPDGIINKCRKLLNKIKAHQRISKSIQDYKTQIEEVGCRNWRYRRNGVMSTRDANEMVDSRALVIFKEASELVGIDEPKNELISLLTGDESSSQHQVKVVCILGFGGLGKTTLAKQVYESLRDKFDCQAFVTVSRNPNMMNVLRTILSDISGQEYAGDVQHLIEKVSKFLQDKRYLIVVDDLWDSKSWEIISRIITTTRINEVAESCRSSHCGHIYTLRPLNAMNSKRLFLKRIFGSEEGCPSHLMKVSDDILKKCDGLPLAIISIAGLLAGKAQTFDDWNKVQRSFGYALERQSDVNKMIQILSLSYFDLPSHLRSCLLYLSIFPEDYKIGKERLVLRWIAEGFIHEEHGFTQYELGERCFNELINRSLIQPADSYLWGPVISCRVHVTIIEFIVSKAMEENFVTLFGVPNTTVYPRRNIRRLSLQDRNEVGDALVGLQENMIYYHARAVSVFPAGSLGSLPSLQRFRHVHHHLSDLGRLFALRYLGLCGTWIHELPEDIGQLQYLQTLDVRSTHIKELPSGVARLARLVNLFCSYHVHLPDGFGNLRELQRLKEISLWIQSPSFAQELRRLRNLRMLDVHIDDLTKDLVSSLCTIGMGSLDCLIIRTNQASINLVMEPWTPTPLNLKLLAIRMIHVPRVPRWVGSLDNLQDLSLEVVELGAVDVGLLGRLNVLVRLDLMVWTEVADRSSSTQEAERVRISSTHGFTSLRMLRVGSWDCGFGLLFEAGAMPKLQELRLMFHRDKTRSLTHGEFDFGIQHLPCLTIVRCGITYLELEEAHSVEDYEPKDPARHALEIAVGSNPNQPKLYYGF
ncbi:hypothetical protein U9M48_041967 [Paspalum notatum var. saurae]|uniref:Uncharacterized protein n=1 Tax=Paspalum notatum var. saurae TaxID=547442 RepID=A0AAQ3XH49_PASNO